jgi:hypothetical protein
MSKLSYPSLKEFGQIFWSIWRNLDTVSRTKNIKELEGDGWLQNLPPESQAEILKSAPSELIPYIHLWKAIHKDTLNILGIAPLKLIPKVDEQKPKPKILMDIITRR